MPSKTLSERSIATAARSASRQSVASWERDQRTQRFGHPTYSDYLGSSAWYRLKARYRKSDLPQDCFLCDADEDIDLHHQTYERVCEEELTDLIPLCGPCHRLAHELVRRGDLPDFSADTLAGLIDPDQAAKNQASKPPAFRKGRRQDVARAAGEADRARRKVVSLRSKGKPSKLAEQMLVRALRRVERARGQSPSLP